MKNATLLDEINGFQEYLKERDSAKVAVDIKENVLAILKYYLEEDKALECIKQLMWLMDFIPKGVTEFMKFETITIPGSDNPIYTELMKHKPVSCEEKLFIDYLKIARSCSLGSFKVFVNDPSVDNGKLQFFPNSQPALGYTYKELEMLAKKSSLYYNQPIQLGGMYDYVLFCAWLIYSLIIKGWSETDAWYSVCIDSKMLGNYEDSEDAKDYFENTGSRKVAGKCDLGNAYKVLAEDKLTGHFYIASGSFMNSGHRSPLARIDSFGRGGRHCINSDYDRRLRTAVGWYIVPLDTYH